MRCGAPWQNKSRLHPAFCCYLSSLASVLMHLVHSTLRTYTPFSSTRTRWRLGLNLRRVARMEWLRRLPNMGPLPQFSHLAMGLRQKMLQSAKEVNVMLPYGLPGCKIELGYWPLAVSQEQRTTRQAGLAYQKHKLFCCSRIGWHRIANSQ